jgi:prevent-host-death family protein
MGYDDGSSEGMAMSFHLTEDFKTLTELAKDVKSIINQVHRTGRPVVVTVDGKPGVVILDAGTYEKRLQASRLRDLLSQGEADIQAGRVRPLEDFVKDMRRGKKIPGKNHHQR